MKTTWAVLGTGVLGYAIFTTAAFTTTTFAAVAPYGSRSEATMKVAQSRCFPWASNCMNEMIDTCKEMENTAKAKLNALIAATGNEKTLGAVEIRGDVKQDKYRDCVYVADRGDVCNDFMYTQECVITVRMDSDQYWIANESWMKKGREGVCQPEVDSLRDNKLVLLDTSSSRTARSRWDAPSACWGQTLVVKPRI